MSNHEVVNEQNLLDVNGEIAEPGWARKQVWNYKRADIKAPAVRIKEWDYYLVMGRDFAVAFTVSDVGYIGLQSVSLLLFGDYPIEHTETVIKPLTMGKLHMPETSSEGDVHYSDDRLQLDFEHEGTRRHLICRFTNFHNGNDLDAHVVLEAPEEDSIVVATPWDQKHAFYYNQKINCMRASGYVHYRGKTLTFNPETDYGTLDWGRGVWTYDNVWYWGNCNCTVDGHRFGFNIGYGFGDTCAATENMLFYDGVGHKLEDVRFNIPGDDGPDPKEMRDFSYLKPKKGTMDQPDYMEPWTFTSSDGRFDMKFVPVLDRFAKTNVGVICTDQHQVFGKISGTAVLDDGTEVHLEDVMCFAEKVHNKY